MLLVRIILEFIVVTLRLRKAVVLRYVPSFSLVSF
jgi:hypothetical protein